MSSDNEARRNVCLPILCDGDILLQVYLLLSCCPCEGRLSGIVDVPNACATLAIPVAIFDQVPVKSASPSLHHDEPHNETLCV